MEQFFRAPMWKKYLISLFIFYSTLSFSERNHWQGYVTEGADGAFGVFNYPHARHLDSVAQRMLDQMDRSWAFYGTHGIPGAIGSPQSAASLPCDVSLAQMARLRVPDCTSRNFLAACEGARACGYELSAAQQLCNQTGRPTMAFIPTFDEYRRSLFRGNVMFYPESWGLNPYPLTHPSGSDGLEARYFLRGRALPLPLVDGGDTYFFRYSLPVIQRPPTGVRANCMDPLSSTQLLCRTDDQGFYSGNGYAEDQALNTFIGPGTPAGELLALPGRGLGAVCFGLREGVRRMRTRFCRGRRPFQPRDPNDNFDPETFSALQPLPSVPSTYNLFQADRSVRGISTCGSRR